MQKILNYCQNPVFKDTPIILEQDNNFSEDTG